MINLLSDLIFFILTHVCVVSHKTTCSDGMALSQ